MKALLAALATLLLLLPSTQAFLQQGQDRLTQSTPTPKVSGGALDTCFITFFFRGWAGKCIPRFAHALLSSRCMHFSSLALHHPNPLVAAPPPLLQQVANQVIVRLPRGGARLPRGLRRKRTIGPRTHVYTVSRGTVPAALKRLNALPGRRCGGCMEAGRRCSCIHVPAGALAQPSAPHWPLPPPHPMVDRRGGGAQLPAPAHGGAQRRQVRPAVGLPQDVGARSLGHLQGVGPDQSVHHRHRCGTLLCCLRLAGRLGVWWARPGLRGAGRAQRRALPTPGPVRLLPGPTDASRLQVPPGPGCPDQQDGQLQRHCRRGPGRLGPGALVVAGACQSGCWAPGFCSTWRRMQLVAWHGNFSTASLLLSRVRNGSEASPPNGPACRTQWGMGLTWRASLLR